MKFTVKDIQPNPFRNMDRYPIRREKVEALRESLRTTGFWDNVVARLVGGKPQIAYGHHRLVALREEFGLNREVELIIKSLDDTAMIRIMSRENLEEWGTSAMVEQETIRSVVLAYAEGKIKLPDPASRTDGAHIRFAPSFVAGAPVGAGRQVAFPYTVQTVADFIGWVRPNGKPWDKVFSSLHALELIELGILEERDFVGLTTKQAESVVDEARRAKEHRDTLAKAKEKEAEQKEKEAAEAEKRRVEASKEKARKEEEARKEEDDAKRRKAEADARKAASEQKRAEEEKLRAEAQSRKARQVSAKIADEGKQRARTVGLAVSAAIRTGKAGYRQAADVAARVDKRKRSPVWLDDFAAKFIKDIYTILESGYDHRAEKLSEIIKYRGDLSPKTRKELAKTLRTIASRFTSAADRLEQEAESSSVRALPPKR